MTSAALSRPVSTRAATRLYEAWANAESRCIKCGFCLPVCPTYRLTGVESASPRGRLDLMYAAAKGDLALAAIEPALALCLGCLACESACPSGIRYRDLLDAQRIDVVAARPRRLLARFLVGTLLNRPALLRALVTVMALYQRSGLQALVRASRLLVFVPPLARLERRMPPVAWPRAWRAAARRWGLSERAEPGAKAAGMLTGCVMDAAFGAAQLATAKLLALHGWRPVAPSAQGCCGALAMHAGEEDLAQAMARRNISAFEAALGGGAPGEGAARPIVVNSAGCGAAMKEYGAWLARDPVWRERAASFSRRVVDLSEFLDRVGLKAPPFPVPLRVAYDDPCHLIHAQRIREQPRGLLKSLPGLRWVELPEADWCCGGAGSYTLAQPEMSARVLERKMERIAALGVDAVATGNPGCLLQLATGARQRGLALRVLHPAELIAMAYGDTPPQTTPDGKGETAK